ncbi:hypothetical protein B0H13DRAFT_2240372 [Mycena leptocephala]|nr:hypothetical protein B0H13DRAFT_2240372 [Mycena leptocephala]
MAPTIAALLQPCTGAARTSDPGGPPKYLALRRWEVALLQHDFALPFPEGKMGRYVKFSHPTQGKVGWGWGWNEYSGGVSLMNAHLAYMSERACDWQWSKMKANLGGRERQAHAMTPLNAIVSGPVADGPFESDDPAPRAVSRDWFDVVCARDERRYVDISARGAKPAPVALQASESGIDILTHWQTRCLEIVAPPRILTLWDSVSQSPISRLLDASPIVGYLFTPRGPRPTHPAPRDAFQRMLAVHLRRGDDYEGFYGWNLFPQLPDGFVSEPDAPGKNQRFLVRCWPDQVGVVRKVAEVRREYLVHTTQSNATLDVVHILSNEKGDLVLDAEQKDVSMAVDMEIARRAAVFVGNGVSLLSSTPFLGVRLLDKRDPRSIHFT